ncbi:MAG: thioredoxin family protein [Candidatus Micrarchaeota archaeon]|nr:thioredoxin family protein [Candidatus Micrarchaeota archaeon]
MIRDVSAGAWDSLLSSSTKPVVVEFWHDQCIWCKRLSPIYEELSKEIDTAVFARLNVLSDEKNNEIGRRYGINGTPTIKVFCKGREAGEIVGYLDKESLNSELNRIIAKAEGCVSSSTGM